VLVTDLLIHPAELAELLAGVTPPTLIDVRWSLTGPPGIGEYRAGHLPGAVFADLDTELSGHRGVAGRHPLPLTADFEALMRRLGVSDSRLVVVYDAGDSVPASRAWWDLTYFGHPLVRVLDGGLAAWRAAGFAVTTETPEVEIGDFVAVPGGLPILDADAAAALAKDGVLIDVRAPERYPGEGEPVDAVAGWLSRPRPAALPVRRPAPGRRRRLLRVGRECSAHRVRDDPGRPADPGTVRRIVVPLDRGRRPPDRSRHGIARADGSGRPPVRRPGIGVGGCSASTGPGALSAARRTEPR
jgi:rhodanese-related sulfurtransferase